MWYFESLTSFNLCIFFSPDKEKVENANQPMTTYNLKF